MDLYKLPKDMLIKLITTIEEETKNKYEVKMKAYREILFISGIKYSICNEEGCGEKSISLPFQQCDYCFLSYCKKHEKRFTCCIQN